MGKQVVPIWRGSVDLNQPQALSLPIVLPNAHEIQNYVRHYADRQRLRLVISKEFKQRTLDQNSYYWGVVIAILSQKLGYWEKKMHEICVAEHYHQRGGFKAGIKTSTSDMSTREFAEYIEWIWQWAAVEHGIYIPPPRKRGNMMLVGDK